MHSSYGVSALEVTEDLLNHHRSFNAGDDFNVATVGAADLDIKNP